MVLSRVCFLLWNSLSIFLLHVHFIFLLYMHVWGPKHQQLVWDPGSGAQVLVVQATEEVQTCKEAQMHE